MKERKPVVLKKCGPVEGPAVPVASGYLPPRAHHYITRDEVRVIRHIGRNQFKLSGVIVPTIFKDRYLAVALRDTRRPGCFEVIASTFMGNKNKARLWLLQK